MKEVISKIILNGRHVYYKRKKRLSFAQQELEMSRPYLEAMLSNEVFIEGFKDVSRMTIELMRQHYKYDVLSNNN